nr:MAG TPA: hypothetical protein [Caudoviricetes sp.]
MFGSAPIVTTNAAGLSLRRILTWSISTTLERK